MMFLLSICLLAGFCARLRIAIDSAVTIFCRKHRPTCSTTLSAATTHYIFMAYFYLQFCHVLTCINVTIIIWVCLCNNHLLFWSPIFLSSTLFYLFIVSLLNLLPHWSSYYLILFVSNLVSSLQLGWPFQIIQLVVVFVMCVWEDGVGDVLIILLAITSSYYNIAYTQTCLI